MRRSLRPIHQRVVTCWDFAGNSSRDFAPVVAVANLIILQATFAFAASLLSITITATSIAAILNIPNDYETVTQAINMSEDGDTVLVQPGNYEERLDSTVN